MLSSKGNILLGIYSDLVKTGYKTVGGDEIKDVFNSFELRPYRNDIKKLIYDYNILSVLDYGSGGADWFSSGFDPETNQSAFEFFNLETLCRYEPARGIDERQLVDCVISFDVLEHIFIFDVASVLRDMLKNCRKLLILNVACYPANATLPNGENAHITIRSPEYWKGMIDCIAPEFPEVEILLACSSAYRSTDSFPIFSASMWLQSKHFTIEF